jgi:tripeptidyl-peptidase-1
VTSWVVTSGIDVERVSQSTNKAWLQFDAAAEEMERLLKTKYHYYEHVNGGRMHIGCNEYKLPAAVSDHVDYVTPGVKFVATKAIGNIKKRNLDLSSSNRISNEKLIPPDLLASVKQNPSMLY